MKEITGWETLENESRIRVTAIGHAEEMANKYYFPTKEAYTRARINSFISGYKKAVENCREIVKLQNNYLYGRKEIRTHNIP
jgi:hypothetical protein